MERYKAIISNNRLYREVELAPETKTIRVGTYKGCAQRFDNELFFEEFEIVFENQGEVWALICGDNNYISSDGILKLAGKKLVHGDEVTLKYKDSNQEVFAINFVLDFDYDSKDYEKVLDITSCDEITIGGTANCDIVLQDPLMGIDSVYLFKKQGQWMVQDNDTRYGVYINGTRAQGQSVVNDYDFFSIIGYSFYYKHGKLYTSKKSAISIADLPCEIHPESDGRFEYPQFNRSTRIKYLLPKEEIQVLDPPAPPTETEQNIVMTLMPTLAMMVLTVVVRGQMSAGGGGGFILFSVLSMSVGIISSIFTYIHQKKKYKKDTVNRDEKYRAYIQNKRTMLSGLRKHERAILEDVYYSPEKELELVTKFSSDLFNRTDDDEDFLSVRVGTGPVASNQAVGYKQQETFEVEDELADLPAAIAAEFALLAKAPITVDCASTNAIGIVGTRARLYEMAKNMLLDITTRQYYSDVQLFLVVGQDYAKQFTWARLVPHLHNERLNMRNIICDDESKNTLFEYLYTELSYRETAKTAFPRIVVLVYDDVGLKRHPISKYIENAAELGVTFLFFEESKDRLPLGCGQVVLLRENETTGQIVSSEDNTRILNFSYEAIDDIQAASFAQKLAPIYCEEISLEGNLTKNISLYQLLEINSVQDLDLSQRWQTSEIHKSMAAPLGVKSKEEIVALDLHEKYHGPHGLVAGTTGSGKSEILQSYILSMATLFHPYEVGFVIIDFKGGGMVNQFKDLPHLVGSITNIDGREIDRSLLSIKAELRKRQELFAQYDVNHINAYIQLFKKGQAKVPLPHLILIVDEFAELKMDQPEFMKELVSAARIGRSLGVHLILATQKPSGVVDAQIWSNSKFKLCLKVQNKEDSNEVLKSPLAAEIKEPGRAYLQVGNNEIFELFQSAYSGAPASINTERKKKYALYSVELSGKKSKIFEQKQDVGNQNNETQLDAIVDYVAGHCENNHIERLPGICLPPLPEKITYAEHATQSVQEGQVIVPLGLYDDPNNQRQEQVNLDLLSGNTFINGASQFGKTALLQLLLRGVATQYTPEEVSVYIMDFASMALKVFDTLPHVGGVITVADDIKLKTFFRMILQEMAFRKEKLSKIGITSFTSYKEGGFTDLPLLVIMLDNIVAFRELFEDYDDEFMGICREGMALGIQVVVTTTQTRSLGYKYLSNFANRIALFSNQKDEYATLFERCKMEPKSVPGRALIAINREVYEYQNYLPFSGEKEIDRVADIRAFIQETAEKHSTHAWRIPEIPDMLLPGYFAENAFTAPAYTVFAGMEYDTVSPVMVNLLQFGYIAISGREKSGKTNFVRYIFHCLEKDMEEGKASVAYVLDDYERQLEPLKASPLVKTYATEIEDVESLFADVYAESVRRKEAIKQGGIKAIKDEPLLFVVIQNKQFFEPNTLSKESIEICKNLLKLAKETRLFILFSNVENAPIPYSGADLLKQIKDTKNVLLFDDLVGLKLFDVMASEQRANKKPLEIGDAFFIQERSLERIKTPYIL